MTVQALLYLLKCMCAPSRILQLTQDSDDEYITEEGYLDQPEGRTPILSGFYYISKLFRSAPLNDLRSLHLA